MSVFKILVWHILTTNGGRICRCCVCATHANVALQPVSIAANIHNEQVARDLFRLSLNSVEQCFRSILSVVARLHVVKPEGRLGAGANGAEEASTKIVRCCHFMSISRQSSTTFEVDRTCYSGIFLAPPTLPGR